MVDQLELRDRQDAQIWNAIEANNFKQALKLVDKKLSKKHTDYLEALKIYIRSRSPLPAEKSAVLLYLEELAERRPALTDLDAVELYDEAFGEIIPRSPETWEKIIGQMRWQCIKAMPKNEDASLKCFQECLSNGDLDHARQIANSLEKNFPKNHNYIFWNITTMFIFASSQNCPENQKKIWGGLALGQIGKLAKATKQAPDPRQLPTRSIHTPQELLLLHRITEAYGKSEQRLEYLQNSCLEPEAPVAKGEWELWRFKLKLLEKNQRWEELFDTTSALLKRARTKNASSQLSESRLSDWIVWEAYIRSATHLDRHQYASRVMDEVEAHLDPASGIDKSWRRNASLAWIKFHFETSSTFSGSHGIFKDSDRLSSKVIVIIRYLQEYGSSSTGYNDLKEFVELLDHMERTQLLSLLTTNMIFGSNTMANDEEAQSESERSSYPTNEDLLTASQITQAVNTYKLKYLLTCALPEYERGQSPAMKSGRAEFICASCTKLCTLSCQECLQTLARDAIHWYHIAIDDKGRISQNLLTTDRHPADDLSVISAMCLIKLSLQHVENGSSSLICPRIGYLLRAAILLECAWSRSKSNFQLSLMLVRLYHHLGCGSLAMRAYQRLALKQIQLDTLSSTLFDRISTFHPHPFSHPLDGSSKDRSPAQYLKDQQKIYKTARENITRNIWLAFKHSSYNSIFEMMEVFQKLSCSVSAASSVIESRKISRLIEPQSMLTSSSNGYDILPQNPEDAEVTFFNTIDYESFPNFESSLGPRFEELSRFFPALSSYRCRINLVAEKLFLIIDPSSDQTGEKHILLQWLKEHLSTKEKSQFWKDGFLAITPAENLARKVYAAMAIIIGEICDGEQQLESASQKRLEMINKDFVSGIKEVLALVDRIEDSAPAFGNTLHVIYTAHEIGRMAINFCRYVERQRKDVHRMLQESNKKVEEDAEHLLQLLVEKCATIKNGLLEGGWIDKILECTLPDEGKSDIHEGKPKSEVEALSSLLDEDFAEEWAGHIVESWGDSVIGLSYLKNPPKA